MPRHGAMEHPFSGWTWLIVLNLAQINWSLEPWNYFWKVSDYFTMLTTSFQSAMQYRVATKIFEGFWGMLCEEFIIARKPVSIVLYTRPGTCINRPLHWAWIQYQAAHPERRGYTTPCKLACFYPKSSSKISLPLYNWSLNCCNFL